MCGVVEFSQCAAQCVVMRMCDVVDACCFCYSYGCVIRVCVHVPPEKFGVVQLLQLLSFQSMNDLCDSLFCKLCFI